MKSGIHPKYNEYDVILTTGEVVKIEGNDDSLEGYTITVAVGEGDGSFFSSSFAIAASL